MNLIIMRRSLFNEMMMDDEEEGNKEREKERDCNK